MKKTKRVSKELLEKQEQSAKELAALEVLLQDAQQEEQTQLATARESIDNTCGEDLFCGIILTKDDILALVKMALDTSENIKIPYQLYFNE